MTDEETGSPKKVYTTAPLSKQAFTDEMASKFDDLPDWERKFIVNVISKGSTVSSYKDTDRSPVHYIKEKNLKSALEEEGIDANFIAKQLKKCLIGRVTKYDKTGKPYDIIDPWLILKAVSEVAKIRGEIIAISKRENEPDKGVVDLFEEVDLSDGNNGQEQT